MGCESYSKHPINSRHSQSAYCEVSVSRGTVLDTRGL